jgi:hypothetical protein
MRRREWQRSCITKRAGLLELQVFGMKEEFDALFAV